MPIKSCGRGVRRMEFSSMTQSRKKAAARQAVAAGILVYLLNDLFSWHQAGCWQDLIFRIGRIEFTNATHASLAAWPPLARAFRPARASDSCNRSEERRVGK